jgi:hypothetical protein
MCYYGRFTMMTLVLSSKTVFGMFINFGEGEYRLEATYKHFHLWRKAKQRQAQAILNM